MSTSLQPYRERARAHHAEIESAHRPYQKPFSIDTVFLGPEEAAQFLGITVKQLRDLVPPSFIVGRRTPRWSEDDLIRARGRTLGGCRVYAIARHDTKEVKIGVSANPLRRLETLQAANGEPLKLVAVVLGGVELEVELHERFKAHRKMGEWFHLSPELLAWIEEVSR